MPYPALQPPPSDEGLLNKSLLDQLDAQADAEPVSSSASDDSSHDSPRVAYHTPAQTLPHDPQPPKINAFYPRASFNAFPNATRAPARPAAAYREPPSASAPQFYPQQPDAFPPLTSPVLQPYDTRGSFDFKGGYAPVDYAVPPLPAPQQPPAKLNGYAAPYMNGAMHSQTPYGPHVPTSIPMGAMNGAGLPPPTMMPPSNNTQEDISTIFVVGFPEDMQEREFQNMFTFSPGFEAATLKIPNKEYTSYGLPPGSAQQRALGGAGQYNSYAGSNDPYNLVTVNQGGVLVDSGDGIASWPAPPDTAGQQSGQSQPHGGPPSGHFAGVMPPRKQIIGFAKFRTREEALGARDVLQGRRIDIDKGAVLKAEMAKKNLHTKRGVGPVGGGGNGMGGMNGVGVGPAVGLNGVHGGMNGGMGMLGEMYPDAMMSPREREAGALVAMGLPPPGLPSAGANNPNGPSHANSAAPLTNGVRIPQWRGNQMPLDDEEVMALHEQERERERRQSAALSAMGLRGPRERAEDERVVRTGGVGIPGDEGERLRRRERERRSGPPAAFEAFAAREDIGPWDGVRLTAPSNRSSSPDATPNVNGDFGAPFAGEVPRAFSSPPPPGDFLSHSHHSHFGGNYGGQQPPFMPGGVHESFPHHEPPSELQPQQQAFPAHRQERSESSASDGSASAGELERGMARLAVRNASAASLTSNNAAAPGTTAAAAPGNAPITIPSNSGSHSNSGSTSGSSGGSPQLASPASSGAGRAVDQNPPINTLYVGNLPSSGTQAEMSLLERELRDLFATCVGFRQMSFRHKQNGPMCFVEFEDVGYAAKTMNEMYGNTLNGLIKSGGMRLSYSKNPLGVRTPTSASGANGSLQQQQSMAAAEAAFHQRLTSPPPSAQQDGASAYAPSFAAPRFFAAQSEAGAWGRRWETDHRTVPRALGLNGPGPIAAPSSAAATATTFSPFTQSPAPPEPPAEGEAQ